MAIETGLDVMGSDGSEAPLVLFVAGTGHSGSTLVSFVLNTHPRIFAVGEMHAPVFPREHPEQRMCSCGVPMAKCPFFEKLADELAPHGLRLNPVGWDLQYKVPGYPALSRFLTGSLHNTMLEELRDSLTGLVPTLRTMRAKLDRDNWLFIRTVLKITDKRVFVDATKAPIRIRDLRRLPVRLKVLHLVRDPRAYVFSRMRDAGLSARTAAGAWLRTNTNVERHLRSIPRTDWIRTRYEIFCSHTENELGRIGELLGVGPISVPEDFRRTNHHIMGNKMRLMRSANSAILLDDQWNRHLSADVVAAVAKRVHSLAWKYGYEL